MIFLRHVQTAIVLVGLFVLAGCSNDSNAGGGANCAGYCQRIFTCAASTRPTQGANQQECVELCSYGGALGACSPRHAAWVNCVADTNTALVCEQQHRGCEAQFNDYFACTRQ